MGRTVRPVLLALACALLTACATVRAPGGSVGDQAPADTSNTLRVMAGQSQYMKAVVDAFADAHPDIDVEWTQGGVSFEDGTAQALLRSGRGPDVLLVNSGPSRVGAAARSGLLAPLDDILRDRGISARYPPSLLEQTRQRDGKTYEVVEGMDVFQVYYDKTIFTEHELQVPRTWADLLSACDRLNRAGVQPLLAGIRDDFAGGWLLGAIVQSSAGRETMRSVIDGDTRFDRPDVVRGVGFLRELVDRGCLDGKQAAAFDGDQARASFWKGNAAMTVMPQGALVERQAEGADIDRYGSFAFPTPTGRERALPTAGLAVSWVVSRNTKSLSAVAAWLDWVSSTEYLQLSASRGGTLVPARNVPASVRLPSPVRDASVKLRAGTGYNPSVYLPGGSKDAWYQAVQGVVVGGVEPRAAARSVQSALATARRQEGGG